MPEHTDRVAYRLLLTQAAHRYDKHEAGRPEPFNVFSILRSQHDEVNLHSRFLHSLLDYRQPPKGDRRNLEDFLSSVSHTPAAGPPDLDPNRARVERESANIDILIRDDTSRHALVIENKIGAGDQPAQLRRSAARLKRDGYKPRLLYLTLDGHSPSEDSAAGLDYNCISYKENLPPWLRRCQRRAYESPPLRESIAQYLHLIAKLTRTDYSEGYMSDLKDLCLESNNLVLAHDLSEAVLEARVSLLHRLWHEIADNLKAAIADLPNLSEEDSDITEERIRRFVTYQRNYRYHGLYYTFGSASLSIEVEDSVYFGVACYEKENRDEYNRLKKVLQASRGEGLANEWWPWYRYAPTSLNLRNSSREDLELLASEEKRHAYVSEIVSGVCELWERIK